MSRAWLVLATALVACNDILGHHPGVLADANETSTDPCAAWAPSSLANLVVWLQGDVVDADDAGAVVRWPDQSKRGNDALLGPDVGAPTPPPRVRAGVVNGHATVRFATSVGPVATYPNLRVPDVPDLEWGSSGYVLAVVVAYESPGGHDEWGGYGSIWSKVESAYPSWGVTLTANAAEILLGDGGTINDPSGIGGWACVSSYSAQCGTMSAPSMNNGVFHVVVLQRDASGTVLSLHVDGVRSDVVMPPHAVDAVGVDVAIGGRPVTNATIEPLDGDLAEVVAAKGAVSDDDERCLETYLRTKFVP